MYTVVLPANLEWSNGAPITVADVAATEHFALSTEASDTTLAAALRGVKIAAGQSTIAFTLPAPRASFAATLTQMPILPLGAMSGPALLAAATHPTVPLPTSGPYDVESTAALAIVLQPNAHAPARPSIKSYELRLFVTFADAAYAFSHGSIDALLATTPAELSTLLTVKGAQAESMTTPEFVDLMFNERVPALADLVVRHAIDVAVNRSAVVAGALDGRDGDDPDRPVLGGYPVGGLPDRRRELADCGGVGAAGQRMGCRSGWRPPPRADPTGVHAGRAGHQPSAPGRA